MATDVLRLPIADAARQLGCSVKTLTRRGAEGRLELVKDGSRLYVPKAALDAYTGEQQAAAGWEELDDLRLLFPIPELDERRRASRAAREAAASPTTNDEETER